MTFVAASFLSISINLLLLIFVVVCLLMTLVILMQRPKQEGLGAAFGGGVTDQVFGARTTNVLQRGTVYLGSLFFILSLALAVLISNKNRSIKLLPDESAAKVEEAATPAVEDESLKPKSLLEELPTEDPPPAETPEDAAASEPAPVTVDDAAPEEAPSEDAAPAPEPAPADEVPAPAETEGAADEKAGEP
jgi:preprotein translocase subunit SecG